MLCLLARKLDSRWLGDDHIHRCSLTFSISLSYKGSFGSKAAYRVRTYNYLVVKQVCTKRNCKRLQINLTGQVNLKSTIVSRLKALYACETNLVVVECFSPRFVHILVRSHLMCSDEAINLHGYIDHFSFPSWIIDHCCPAIYEIFGRVQGSMTTMITEG